MKINNLSSKKPLYIILGIVGLILIGLVTYYIFPRQHKDDNAEKYGSSQTNPNKNTPTADANGSTGGMANSKGADDSPAPAADPSITPTVPTGTFVSNHHPNLSGQPAPNTISSTCTTTPGVACQIKFTSGGVTKTLEPQVTNSDGNTSWIWNLNDIGLTVGDWKVIAVATNGDKVTTADDSMLLSIKQ